MIADDGPRGRADVAVADLPVWRAVLVACERAPRGEESARDDSGGHAQRFSARHGPGERPRELVEEPAHAAAIAANRAVRK